MVEIALLVGTLASAAGSLIAGNDAKAAAETQAANEAIIADSDAKQLRSDAQHERAASRFAAKEKELVTGDQISKIIARAASGGGGVLNPTVVHLLDETRERGTVLAQAEVFKGEQRAKSLLDQATTRIVNAKNTGDVLRLKGKAAQTAGRIKAVSTVALGASESDFIKASFG